MTPIWPSSTPPEDGNEHSADQNDEAREKFRKPDLRASETSRAPAARERLLARIAASLNRPEAEFLEDAPDGAAAEEPDVLVAECAELVRLYCSFSDPENRRQWLSLLRAAVART